MQQGTQKQDVIMKRRRLPEGITLSDALLYAMKRLGALGVVYPEGHYEMLVKKYTLETVPYPYIVMHMGEARIRQHFFYPDLLRTPGFLLDYGCGTGDAIRQLILDGYPKERITGFDVNDASLRIGYDLYLDQNEMEQKVSVSPVFPCPQEKYDYVYSGSVIHVLRDEGDFYDYLRKAYHTLKPNGTFFGSTLGRGESVPQQKPGGGPPRLMRKGELRAALKETGLGKIRVVIDTRRELVQRRPDLCLFQFLAEKK